MRTIAAFSAAMILHSGAAWPVHPDSPLRRRVMEKRAFDIDEVVRRLRKAVRPYAPAALFDLGDRGFGSAFQQLVACMISIRTRDEVTTPMALALFQRAATPAQVAALPVEEIDRLIHDCAFHEAKAGQIAEIARRLVSEHDGELGCDEELILSFRGVGPKCANLVLGIACGVPRIGVDVHVHRVTNRWGYVQASTPEGTMRELQSMLPERYHVEINRLLVPFGKHVCTGRLPRCSTCPVLEFCRQVGVEAHR
ncbi:MAG TPA: endonuclease III [Longimicrobium sp.]|uniref:endonuclease III domain-containing protein n=1 Tax=Longimicrobium sp. TaxID=2029185 RepID=UPI002ED91C24